jgi:serine/threonine-protein kinase
MSHVHRRGLYHGDLKPADIMLTRTGQVKRIDFGTAWVRGQEKNRIQGTPQYIAPERATEEAVNDRTDIDHLGATMHRMFAGRFAQQAIPKGARMARWSRQSRSTPGSPARSTRSSWPA